MHVGEKVGVGDGGSGVFVAVNVWVGGTEVNVGVLVGKGVGVLIGTRVKVAVGTAATQFGDILGDSSPRAMVGPQKMIQKMPKAKKTGGISGKRCCL